MRLQTLLVLIALLLAGCSVKYKTVGSFDDFNEVFLGDVDHNLMSGGATFSIETKNSKIKCDGIAYPPDYVPPLALSCAGQRGRGSVSCTDGRRLNIEWFATSCTTGYGKGTDQNGIGFRFAFGFDDDSAQSELAKVSKAVAANPELPVYRPKEHRKQKGFSTGTGFFVTTNGVLVTNYHVIEGASQIVVTDPSKRIEYVATVLRVDPANDVAILKVDAQTTPIPLASQMYAARGDEVFTLGYPLVAIQGQEQKATFGRVNALSGLKDDIRLLQVDVPIQPGNSGGPLINRRGEAIGVITATLDQIVTLRASGSLPQNVNFAVKIDYVLPVLRSVVSNTDLSIGGTVPEERAVSQLVALREPSVLLVIAK